MTDLASISDEWWHGASPNMRGGDYSWGGDEEVYFDPEGNPISKEDFEKQFQNQDKFPVEPEYPEQPQFVGDPSQFKPMPFDPNNPMMYMGSGSPFYHLRGGFSQEHIDMLARAGNALYGDLTPEKVVSGALDAVQDFLKTPEQKEAEKRQKEEEERIQKEKEEREKGSWSSILSPFFHLSGGAIDKYIAMAKQFAKKAGYKDWDTLRRADDGEHKLELRGVKFGRKGYGDFIKYSLDEGVDEAQKHRSAYLSRATKIKGDWAKDMYSPNSLAINILWDGKGSCPMSGGMKTEAELEAMSVVKLIDYGKTLGVKGLDGKTKKVIMEKIMSHEAKMPEVVAPTQIASSEPQSIKPLQLIKMLMMDGHLERDIIPLAKRTGIERILHKNKKQLVTEIMEKQDDYIDDGMNIDKVPQYVMYLFGKAENPYADEEDDEEAEIDVDEYELDEENGYDPPVTYMVEDLKDGMHWQDRRVFTPTGVELGTLGEKKFEDLVNVYGLDRDEYTSARLYNLKVAPPAPEPAPVTTTTTTTTTSAPPLLDNAVYTARSGTKYRRDGNPESLGLRPNQSYLYVNSPPGFGTTVFPPGTPPEVIEDHDRRDRERTAEHLRRRDRELKRGRGKKPVLAPQDVLEGKKDNPLVEETIEEPMDDGDIRQYLPNAKIMRYSGLARLSDIEQLLPTDKSYVILLYENTPGSGHWVALMRYGRTIEFFCSYGSKIDVPLRWQNPKDNAVLGQSRPFLSILLNKAKNKFRAIHNPVAYQSSKQGVATCGAWDVMRINQMKNHNQDLQEFHDYMESVKKETGLTYDEIVVNYVSKR